MWKKTEKFGIRQNMYKDIKDFSWNFLTHPAEVFTYIIRASTLLKDVFLFIYSKNTNDNCKNFSIKCRCFYILIILIYLLYRFPH